GAQGDNCERHSCPGQVEGWPAFRDDKLDDSRHGKQGQSREPSAETENQEDRQSYLGHRGDVSDYVGNREAIFSAEDVELEFFLKKVRGTWRERQKSVPPGQARAEKRHGKSYPEHRRCYHAADERKPIQHQAKYLSNIRYHLRMRARPAHACLQ